MISRFRITAVILLFVFVCGMNGEAIAKKKKYKRYYRKPVKRSSFYRYRKAPVKVYQEIVLSPKVSDIDAPRIEAEIKDRGAVSARIDHARNSLIVQYSSKTLSAVDIMQALKELGFTAVSID